MLRQAWAGVLAAAAAAASWHPNAENDIFFHLDLGRAVLRYGARVVPEPTAFAGFERLCVVPAWLWDITAFEVYRLSGFIGLGLMTAATAVLGSLAIAQLCRRGLPDDALTPYVVVSGAVLACAANRYQMRPQTLSLLVLTGYMLLVQRYVEARGRERALLGVGIAGLSLIWAQVHGSFVLSPIVLAAFVLPDVARSTREDLRTDGVVLLACLISLTSSAVGLGVASYIIGHGSGDAVKYIVEMRAPDWSLLPDIITAAGRAQTLLWLLALLGVARDGKVRWGEIACALLGLLLFSRAVRFAAEDALLTAPLAVHGARNIQQLTQGTFTLRTRATWAAVFGLWTCGSLGLVVQDMRDMPTARFALGLADDAMPELASRYLRRLPAGSNVLTSFGAGPMIGFYAQGKIRTFVDGRTPMYFDDTDYALERDILSEPTALELGIARFSIKAAVIDRDHGACDLLAKRWIPVVVEGRYSTFVPPGYDEPLRGVDPCGPAPFRDERCRDGGRDLERSIERLARLGNAPMLWRMRAAKELLCGGSVARAAHDLDAAEGVFYLPPHRRLRARALLQSRQTVAAFELLRDALEDGDQSVLQLLTVPEAARFSLQQTRQLLELGLGQLADGARPGLRLHLAALCMRQGDAECVRFQALRAASKGASEALGALYWLQQYHPVARVRADAAAWARILAARAEDRTSPAPATSEP